MTRQVKVWEDTLGGSKLQTLLQQWYDEGWSIEVMSTSLNNMMPREIVKVIIMVRDVETQ